jgi:hypothetical protein
MHIGNLFAVLAVHAIVDQEMLGGDQNLAFAKIHLRPVALHQNPMLRADNKVCLLPRNQPLSQPDRRQFAPTRNCAFGRCCITLA